MELHEAVRRNHGSHARGIGQVEEKGKEEEGEGRKRKAEWHVVWWWEMAVDNARRRRSPPQASILDPASPRGGYLLAGEPARPGVGLSTNGVEHKNRSSPET